MRRSRSAVFNRLIPNIVIYKFRRLKSNINLLASFNVNKTNNFLGKIIIYGLFFITLLLASGNSVSNSADGPQPDLQHSLRKDHPRLIFTAEDQIRIEKLAYSDTLLSNLLASLMFQAEQMFFQKPIEYHVVGPRLLHQSRKCLSRVMTLSLAYRLSGNTKFAELAVSEMHRAALFPDWNPSHFLDTAELAAALAIGYDWLYDILSREERDIIKQALIEKALKPGLQEYPGGFARKINNWNFVCNGGLIMAALAIAEDEPDLAGEIISKALSSLPNALVSYAPDGAWFEGPSYWMYGTNYLLMLIAALKSALNNDYGISETAGLSRTGNFYLGSIGPSGKFFNYADCRLMPRGVTPALFKLAEYYDTPFYAYSERQMLGSHLRQLDVNKFGEQGDNFFYRFFPLAITWYNASGKQGDKNLTNNSYFLGESDIVYFRSGWDRDDVYIGFKAGHNGINHSHLDCGTFVFEAEGERWAQDLGSDNYNLPGYFEYHPDGRRWNYYRNASVSHNVITINKRNQNVKARARLMSFYSDDTTASAVIDLSEVHDGQARSIFRGISLSGCRQVLIQDEIHTLNSNDTLRWAMLTSADIDISKQQAILSKGSKSVYVEIVEPNDAVFSVTPTRPDYHPQENPNIGTRQLSIVYPVQIISSIRIVVSFKSVVNSEINRKTPPVHVTPLVSWPGKLAD